MKVLLSSRGLFSLGFILLAVSNVVVFWGVASNRSGEPDSQVILSERELGFTYQRFEESSGLGLRLSWRALGKEDIYGYSGWNAPVWLNGEKLEELGFQIDEYLSSTDNPRYYKKHIPKEVFIVLELDGEPYQEAVRRAEAAFERAEKLVQENPQDEKLRDSLERAEERLTRERQEETRLYAIDAGLDAGGLREKYRDRSRYIIAEGVVHSGYHYNKTKKEVYGYISGLSVARIHVPLEYQQLFDSFLDQYGSTKSNSGSYHYEVELAYGQRLEPWIVSVRSAKR